MSNETITILYRGSQTVVLCSSGRVAGVNGLGCTLRPTRLEGTRGSLYRLSRTSAALDF